MTLEQAKKITIRTNLFWNDDGKKTTMLTD